MSDVVVRLRKGGSTYREVVRDNKRIGWVRHDQMFGVWDAYSSEKVWLRGFPAMEDAVQHLRIRSFGGLDV